ncbi:hypothetical protein U9M48_015681 [Paspalum notatum var. saurae]|uniref:Uncharacterized protein n=1 Tax=Paspalum notatum var. saurae TaxID=547442 RepID=A0AAQ3T5T0_PASNO
MGISRRFQSLVMANRCAGSKSLHSVDLTRQLFCNTATSPSAIGGGSATSVVAQDYTSQAPSADTDIQKNEQKTALAALKMPKIRLPPRPNFSFQAITSSLNEPCKIDCFPLSDRKMVWVDDLGRPFFFNAGTRQMDIIPNLQKPKGLLHAYADILM